MRAVLSISLPDKVARELERFAKSQGRNKSDVVKESISIYLWNPALRAPGRAERAGKEEGHGDGRGHLQGSVVKALFDTNVLLAAFPHGGGL